MKRSKNRSKSKSKKGGFNKQSLKVATNGSFSKSRSKKIKNEIPMCKPKLYCGGKPKAPSFENYDGLGSKDECFKKGMGVGMMIELQKIKTKLATKGIILVTKKRQKSKCIDKSGNIKLQ
jgi:hypothetical protein